MEKAKGELNNGQIRQLFAAIVVNLCALTYGIACAWPSPMVPKLQSASSPVGGGPMSNEGASWLGALLCLGGLCAAPLSGPLMERLGRKGFGYVASVPPILCCLLSIFASGHGCIYAARFLSGVGGSMSLFLAPSYVSEIASEDNRGALGSLLVFAINIGILFTFVTGSLLSYTLFNVVLLLFPLLFLGTFIFMPETPVYLARKGRIDEARRSLMFFKGNNKALVEQEFTRLQCHITSHDEAVSSKKVGLCNLFRDRATLKGTIICFGLLGGQQLSGIFAMISSAETIFNMAGTSLSSDTAAIVIGAIQVFGSYLSTVLMERAGRRPLILISCAGMSACHLIVGLFCYLLNAKYDVSSVSWLPVAALSVYMIAYCLGMGPAPFVLVSEVFRVDIAGLANTVCFTFLWFVAFVVIKVFAALMDSIGVESCFFIMATSCAACFFFAYFLVPETKGRRREGIVAELAGEGPRSSRCDDAIYVQDKEANGKELMVAEQV